MVEMLFLQREPKMPIISYGDLMHLNNSLWVFPQLSLIFKNKNPCVISEEIRSGLAGLQQRQSSRSHNKCQAPCKVQNCGSSLRVWEATLPHPRVQLCIEFLFLDVSSFTHPLSIDASGGLNLNFWSPNQTLRHSHHGVKVPLKAP